MRVPDGALVAYSGTDWVSNGINLVTAGIPHWGVSHVGIACRGRIYEATRDVGVRSYDPTERIESFDGRVWVYPLYRHLYDHERARLSYFLESQVGKDYDIPGVFAAGGILWSRMWSVLAKQSLVKLFCSELVASAYQTTGIYPSRNVSWYSPNRLVRTLHRRGLLQLPWRIQ
jgi:hypothetical protein